MKFDKRLKVQTHNVMIEQAAIAASEDQFSNFFWGTGSNPNLTSANLGVSEDAQNGELEPRRAALSVSDAVVSASNAQDFAVKACHDDLVKVIAKCAGVLTLDVGRIVEINKIAPVVSFATLPNLTRVVAGNVVAAIKVVSRSVQEEELSRICRVVRQSACDLLTIRGAVRTTATLIETQHPGSRFAPNGRRTVDERLDRLGARLVQVKDVPHTEDAIAQAISQTDADMIIMLTAAPTSSLTDCAPQGLQKAGGTVDRFGMPVHPGSGLFIGTHDGRPVVCMPTSARSLASNGADWVLERLVCGISVTSDDIANMAVGGVLSVGREHSGARGFTSLN